MVSCTSDPVYITRRLGMPRVRSVSPAPSHYACSNQGDWGSRASAAHHDSAQKRPQSELDSREERQRRVRATRQLLLRCGALKTSSNLPETSQTGESRSCDYSRCGELLCPSVTAAVWMRDGNIGGSFRERKSRSYSRCKEDGGE